MVIKVIKIRLCLRLGRGGVSVGTADGLCRITGQDYATTRFRY